MTHTLTVRRAADRRILSDILATAMRSAGATATVEPCSYETRQIDVRITAPGGASIRVGFNGSSSQPDIYVATWNTPDCVFISPSLGNVNPHHFGKLNRTAYGIEELIACLVRDIERFADGSGYLAHDSAQIVAMTERYAANGWHDPRKPRPAYDWESVV